MQQGHTHLGEVPETVLFAIRNRLEQGRRPALRPSEAAALLTAGLTVQDAERRAEYLALFQQLVGLELVAAALSDFD